VRADELLTIDIAAELRKLATATLEGPWQAPAELVRRALLAGARHVSVDLGDPLVVRDDGEPLSEDRCRQLETVLDARRPEAERHRALVALEEDPGLLAVAALRPRRVRFEEGLAGGTTVVVEGATLDASAARRWLQTCTRFSTAEVVVDGIPAPRGFGDPLLESALPPPLVGRLALTAGEESAHVWLLLGGVVTAHLTLPDAPAFEAAVEMDALVSSRTPAALREAVAPHLPALTDHAMGFLLEAAVRGRDEERRRHARLQLLAAARLKLRFDEIVRAPLYRALLGPDGREERLLCLLDLQGGKPRPCLDPRDDPAAFLLPPGPVLLIEAEERGRLSELLDIRFRPLAPRRLGRGLGARLRRAFLGWVERARDVASRLRHPGAGRPLPEAALSSVERSLLLALRAALPGARLYLTDGVGRPRRVKSGWRVPRRSDDVARAARLVARDPSWAYPAALALLGGIEAPGAAAAEAWRRRLG
jgi:hypothetical protein